MTKITQNAIKASNQTLPLVDIVQVIGSELHAAFIKNKDNASLSDLQRTLIDLSGIAILNLETVADYFDDKNKVYPIAGATRLIVECYADAYHLINNPAEATEYHNAQNAISTKLKDLPSLDDKRNFIGSRELGDTGRLGGNTTKRVANLPENYGGPYSILCCYTHPNMAAPSWFNQDRTNYLNRYFLYVSVSALFSIMSLMEENDINYSAQKTISLQGTLLSDYIGDIWSDKV